MTIDVDLGRKATKPTNQTRAVIFGMMHFLNQKWPTSKGSHALHRFKLGVQEKILSETIWPRAMIFGM